MKSLLSVGFVLIWASLLNAKSISDVLALGKGNVGPRIAGGRDAEPHEFPYIVSLTAIDANGTADHMCGGSILNERWILTAAHCFSFLRGYYVVRAGAHFLNETMKGEQTSLVSQVIIHPEYESSLHHSIALVELKTPFSFSETVQPIALPPQDEIPLVASAVASGWGAIFSDGTKQIYPNTLQTATISVLTFAECDRITEANGGLDEYEFCAFDIGKSVCSGDSGGPAVQNNMVIGIAVNTWSPCGMYISVFQRVSYYTSWINSYIN